MTSTKIKIRLRDGSQQSFIGREAWTLRHLVSAGRTGVTTIDHPAPRWSHYVYKLRKAGLVISTMQPIRVISPASLVETPVTVVEGAA